jgi:hypothetical protein
MRAQHPSRNRAGSVSQRDMQELSTTHAHPLRVREDRCAWRWRRLRSRRCRRLWSRRWRWSGRRCSSRLWSRRWRWFRRRCSSRLRSRCRRRRWGLAVLEAKCGLDEDFICAKREAALALMVDQQTKLLPVLSVLSPSKVVFDSVVGLDAMHSDPSDLLLIGGSLRANLIEPTWVVTCMDARHSEWHQHDE